MTWIPVQLTNTASAFATGSSFARRYISAVVVRGMQFGSV